MRSNDPIESSLRGSRYQATAEQRERTLQNLFDAMDEVHEPWAMPRRLGLWETAAHSRTGRLVLAAAVILIVLGGIGLWPISNGSKSQWWLGAPAAWGQEITESLKKVHVLTYREGYVFVGDYGSTHISGNWARWYRAADRQRKDTYYNDALVSTTWEVPDGSGSIFQCDVSYEYQCYTTRTHPVEQPVSDPAALLRFYVDLLDKADRVLPPETFEGKECIGFEISAAKYGNNPRERIDRVWFAKETKLPVRIELHGLRAGADQTMTFVQEQFEYDSAVPADIFEPRIPPGFVNAPADTIRQTRARAEKGEMEYAAVPAGLKDDLFAAFRQAQTVAYSEGAARLSVSRDAWRMDRWEGNRVQMTEWHVIQKDDAAPTSLDFNDKNFRLIRTTVDYETRTCTQMTYREMGGFGHPMDKIAFFISLIDQADRFYESAQIDGAACFGFDVSAKKYGTNPDGVFHRVWFNAATNLPVRMETHRPNDDGAGASTIVQEQFDWNPELPEGFFLPRVPHGFTVRAKE